MDPSLLTAGTGTVLYVGTYGTTECTCTYCIIVPTKGKLTELYMYF